MGLAWIGLAVIAAAGIAVAQDTRVVNEPVIPPSCVQLPAMLQSVGDKVDAADEQKLDTVRIQAALDSCKPGMAVELKEQSGKNAFLTGPLELRSGVTLLIDEGVTLYGSRDPKVYEMRGPDAKPDDPVTCGTSSPRPDAVWRPGSHFACCGSSCSGAARRMPAADLGGERDQRGDHGRRHDRRTRLCQASGERLSAGGRWRGGRSRRMMSISRRG